MNLETTAYWLKEKRNLSLVSKSKLWIVVLALCLAGCTASSHNRVSSLENEAKVLTEKMTKVLSLNSAQTDKVLMINVVNLGLKNKLKDQEQLKDADDKFKAEMRKILTEEQYKKFILNF